MNLLVTGVAGFIGFHVALRLIGQGHNVVGIDNVSDISNLAIKVARLNKLGIDASRLDPCAITASSRYGNFSFVKMDITDSGHLQQLFDSIHLDKVINLAAQAGVRCPIDNHYAYIGSNIVGFFNVLDNCRTHGISHFIYASSSSVYGDSQAIPFSESNPIGNPVSLYAATKVADEALAESYSQLYDMRVTGLRFFTVYGPWGRPDMSPMLFAKAICDGNPIKMFNNGDMFRDFTYIDDIVDVVEIMTNTRSEGSASGHKIYNVGCSNPVQMADFVHTLETAIGKTAIKEMMPMQQGDVYRTYADTSALEHDFGYRPKTLLKDGMAKFVEWFDTCGNKLC